MDDIDDFIGELLPSRLSLSEFLELVGEGATLVVAPGPAAPKEFVDALFARVCEAVSNASLVDAHAHDDNPVDMCYQDGVMYWCISEPE